MTNVTTLRPDGGWSMYAGTARLYDDLSWLWPVWSGPESYRDERELFARLIERCSTIRTTSILDVACGGGKNASRLRKHFALTGVDTGARLQTGIVAQRRVFPMSPSSARPSSRCTKWRSEWATRTSTTSTGSSRG